MQQTLEQIRAAHALEACANVQKKSVTKLPAMIVSNGLLATAAFAKDKREGLLAAMDALSVHLRRTGKISETPENLRQRDHTPNDDILNDLKGRDSSYLRLATSETLAYLAFLKRFAKD